MRIGPGGGGLYKRAAEITGISESALQQYKSMADRFELCTRVQNLAYAKRQTKKYPKKNTQARIAARLGVTESCVSYWFGAGGRGSNLTCQDTSPDTRASGTEAFPIWELVPNPGVGDGSIVKIHITSKPFRNCCSIYSQHRRYPGLRVLLRRNLHPCVGNESITSAGNAFLFFTKPQ